jgi:hypothetical protein
MHSLEKIPWNEDYHIVTGEGGETTGTGGKPGLVLDRISFPAFGAGIPEDRGKTCRIEDGMIYMEEISERFESLQWLNSHFAVRELRVGGRLLARGTDLPEHRRLVLRIQI